MRTSAERSVELRPNVVCYEETSSTGECTEPAQIFGFTQGVLLQQTGLYLECIVAGGCNWRAGGPLPTSPLLSHPFPSLRSRFPIIQLGGLGKRCNLFQPTNDLAHSSLKI